MCALYQGTRGPPREPGACFLELLDFLGSACFQPPAALFALALGGGASVFDYFLCHRGRHSVLSDRSKQLLLL